MSALGESVPSGLATEDSAPDIAAPLPVAVYSCNRLGRVANPPGFSLSKWFRSARRG